MRADGPRTCQAMPALRNPITGIAGCCARAASGHRCRAAHERDEVASSHVSTLAHHWMGYCASQQAWQPDFRSRVMNGPKRILPTEFGLPQTADIRRRV